MANHNIYAQEGVSLLISIWPIRKLWLIKASDDQEVNQDINGHKN